MIVSEFYDKIFISNNGILNIPNEYAKEIPKNCFNQFSDSKNKKTDLIIPEGIKIINDFAFHNMSFNHVYLSEGVEEIGFFAFMNCDINYLHLPNSLKRIMHGAFLNVKNLKEFIAPNGLILIGNDAFNYSDIETVLLSKSIKYIYDGAFSNCKNLFKVFSQCDCSSFNLDKVFGNTTYFIINF